MFKRVGEGLKVGVRGVKFFYKNPKTLITIPMFWIVALILGGLVYLLGYLSQYDIMELHLVTMILILIIVFSLYSFSISVASLVLLEMIEDKYNGKSISIKNALGETIRKDLLKVLPLVLVWSIISFVVRMVQFFVNIIYSLYKAVFHWGDMFTDISNSIFGLFQYGVQLVMMMSLPAIAWQDLPAHKAFRKGWKVVKEGWAEILGVVFFSKLVTTLMIISVLSILYYFNNDTLSEDIMLILVLCLFFFVFSINTLIQQYFTAEIYLWYMRWENDPEGKDVCELDIYDKPIL